MNPPTINCNSTSFGLQVDECGQATIISKNSFYIKLHFKLSQSHICSNNNDKKGKEKTDA